MCGSLNILWHYLSLGCHQGSPFFGTGLVHGILQARILEWPFPSPEDLPNAGTEPRSPTLQADSLPTEPPGKPKNTGVGSLSILQWIFPTQESNWDLLHCRRILYQMSYQGSPSLKRDQSNTKNHMHFVHHKAVSYHR